MDTATSRLERLQSMMMKVERMASILQELQSAKKDVAELQELLRNEKIQLEDFQDDSTDQEHGGVPLPSIPEQPTIIQEVSKVQESGGSCSDSTHECIEVQEASVCPEPTESCSDSSQECDDRKEARGATKLMNIQEPSVAQETNDDDHEVSIIHDDDASSNPISDVSSSVAASLASVPPFSESNVSILTPQISLSMDGKLGVNGSLSFDPVEALHTTSVVMGRREASKFRVEVGEPKKLDFRERFQELHKTSSCLEPSLSTLPPSASMTSFAKPMVAVFLLPLSLISLPASLFQFMDCSILEDYERVSRSVELVMVCTCMQKNQFEKSNFLLQLACIFPKGQDKCLELSHTLLVSTFSGCQRYFEDACGFFMLNGQMGFDSSSKAKGPKWFHPWINFKWPTFVQFCPTQVVLQIWFRGKLIEMLYGRICSLSRKKW